MIDLVRGLLHQWDSGRKVKLTGFDKDCSEVHFAREGSCKALVVEPVTVDDDLLADIPNQLLTEGGRLYVYTWKDGRTVSDMAFTVHSRAKPEDYVFTETEVKSFKELGESLRKEIEDRLNEITFDAVSYEKLSDLPMINNVEIKGNKTLGDYGLTVSTSEFIQGLL